MIARAPLIIGRFELKERDVDGVTLRTFFTKQNARLADSYLDAAAEAISSLSDRIGPYPYEAFSVVESPLPVGIGYPGFTLVSGRILPLPFMRGRSLWHEIAHVWWGNGITVDYASGNWAEGFATFFADYALAEANGPEAAREMRFDWLLEFAALPAGADTALRRFVSKSHGQAQAVGYGKAAMVLHMLRREIGADAFNRGIQRFWRENKFQKAAWSDIEAAFAAETPADLRPFFARWIDSGGAGPATASDPDFHQFRALSDDEWIATLRAGYVTGRISPMPVAGAPEAGQLAGALARLGRVSADGTPVYVGDRDAVAAEIGQSPKGCANRQRSAAHTDDRATGHPARSIAERPEPDRLPQPRKSSHP